VPFMFIVIVGTVSVYGLTVTALARRLGLSDPNPQGVLLVGAQRWAREIAVALDSAGFRVVLMDTNWENMSAARMAGLSTFYGSALSEFSVDEMDLEGVGNLLAMTPNDEVNSLAALHFSEIFGRSHVYQLPAVATESPRRESSVRRGRQLFAGTATYQRIEQSWQRGYRIKSTKLTEEFGDDEYKSAYAEDSIPLFLVSESGQLTVWTDEQKKPLKAGQTMIALVYEEEEPDVSAEDAASGESEGEAS
ncbi:MAG: NAD-binding protein, partial [Planctomycetota bacterium]